MTTIEVVSCQVAATSAKAKRSASEGQSSPYFRMK